MRLPVLLLLTTAALRVYAQTITTTNNAGQSIVELITLNGQGNTITQILQTLTTASTISISTTSPATSSTTSSTPSSTTPTTSTSTTPDGQQGPVASPGPTTGTPGGPTPYVYTTTNAAGQTIEVSDTFTPSFPTTVLPAVTSTGTILQYSQWLSMIGSPTGTGSSNLKNGAENRCGIGLIAVLGSIIGVVLVLL